MKKKRDLSIILAIYVLAYIIGYACSLPLQGMVLKLFLFDTIATIVTFVFSCALRNSSVYDAYWSATPMVLICWIFWENKAFGLFQLLFFLAFQIWSLRLTINWIGVFTDFGYEDWRYRKFRDETPKLFWPIVNFFGIHYMPTVVVFLGMLPIFEIAKIPLGLMSVPGICIILLGVCFEYFADRQMHAFLTSKSAQTVCQIGLWRYSRHPNYLGEICIWLGVYLTLLPYDTSHWYLGAGFISIFIMFEVVSIPLMEKRQLQRRPDYAAYQKHTSRLLLLPGKNA